MPAVLALECTLVQELANGQRVHLKIGGDHDLPEDQRLASSGHLTFTIDSIHAPFVFAKGQRYTATLEELDA